MSDYLGLTVESDPDTLMDQALQTLALNLPGFVAKEAHLEVWVLETVARLNAETRYMFSQVPDSIFKYFGQSLVGVQPIEGARATAVTTWTMINDAGYTIPAGTQLAYRVAGDQLSVFTVTEDHTVEPGQTTASDVTIEAIVDGEDQNGLGPTGLELVDSFAFVSTVTAGDPTSGGLDQETDEAYMSRLRNELSLLTPRFVLASDAAVLARRVPGVARALGVDNYNPTNNTFNNEKMLTVAVVGADGLALDAGVKAEVKTYLESLREINFVLHVVDPTYTTVAAHFNLVALPGYDLTLVHADAKKAVTEYLEPGNWAGGDATPPQWRAGSNVVRYLEVAEVLNRVDGVDYVDRLLLNSVSADVTMSGVAPLPSVGNVSGVVTYA